MTKSETFTPIEMLQFISTEAVNVLLVEDAPKESKIILFQRFLPLLHKAYDLPESEIERALCLIEHAKNAEGDEEAGNQFREVFDKNESMKLIWTLIEMLMHLDDESEHKIVISVAAIIADYLRGHLND